MEPSDGPFDPSVIEVPVRVAGVTRTVPGGLSQAGSCPPRAPGVADKTGACPELVEARPRGASAYVETVLHITLRASARRSAQPSTARHPARRPNRVPEPEKKIMARPRPSRRDRVADPDDVSDVHPAELRRLQKEFFSRVDHLVAAFQRKDDEATARGKALPFTSDS